MEVLPNEILNIIFGFLSKKDLLPIRLLSKRMQIRAEDMLSTMYFSFDNVKHVLDFLNITSWRYSKNTILAPYRRFNIKIRSSNEIFEAVLSNYGNEIRGLRIDDIQPIENIFNILMNTQNIEELYISERLYTYEKLKFHLPKLKILGFGHDNINPFIVKHILNSSPNVQQVELKIAEIMEGNNLQDLIDIFQLIYTRDIEVKLQINISTDPHFRSCFRGIILYFKLKEIIEIPFKISELNLEIYEERKDITNVDLTKIQELIEEFVRKQSRNLKHINLKYETATNVDVRLSLDFKNLKNLQSIELSGKVSKYEVQRLIEVKLGSVPLLKKVQITAAKLSFEPPVPQLKHLSVCSDKVFECLNGLGLNDEIFQLEELSLTYLEKLLSYKLIERRVQQLNDLLFSQAKYVKQLKIGATNTMGMDKLQFTKMDNLKRLELNLHEAGYNKVKLQQFHFPYLEILSLNTPFEADYNKSMVNVQTLIIKWASFSDFQKCSIKFPKLRRLEIICNISGTNGFLPFIFQNMTHVKELFIELGGSWNEFTGNSEIVNIFKEITTTNWTLNTSIPNLGSMTALEIFNFGAPPYCCVGGDNHIIAVPYLILCGKLTNLKYFDAQFSRNTKRELIPSIVKICESNNTKTNFRKRAAGIQ